MVVGGGLYESVKSAVKTLLFFVLFCTLLPAFVISYATVSTTRKLWIAFLANRYPYLKFARTNNIRSLVDTSRNPGVFHVLLQIEGICDVHAIRAKFNDHVLNRRDHYGRPCFSRLKFPLISCWGQYAFVKKTKDFNIDNHIIHAPPLHRGRPLTETNLQDYVSDIISKYMPPEIPPWQIFCIPMAYGGTASGSAECDASAPYYYMLYRIHHLLLEEQQNLRISDLLLVDRKIENEKRISDCDSIFANLLERPVYLPRIWNDIGATISNKWNEFIYQHDPLESPDIEKKHIAGIQQLISVVLIGVVTVVSDFSKGFSKVSGNPLMKIDYLKSLIDREIQRRNLNLRTIWNAIMMSIDPINVVKELIFMFWKVGATITLMLPWYVFQEMEAIRIYILMKKIKRNTVIGFALEYLPICFGAFLEYWKGVQLFYSAPKLVFEELFENKPNTEHYLQNVSLCGRKVVSWSEKVRSTELQANRSEKTGSMRSAPRSKPPNDIEVLLAVMSKSLKSLCLEGDGKIPSSIQISGRCMLEDYLFGLTNYQTGNSGFVSLNLPIAVTNNQHLLQSIRSSIAQIRRQQVMLNFLTIAQLKHDFLTDGLPLVVMKLLMNYLSRRFAVTVTEVIENRNIGQYRNLLGHAIKDIIYFRPPQSNTSVSITVQKFNDEIRFACMTDSQINPKHLALTAGFRKHLQDFQQL
ncbi:uncharacterized protein LOC109420076 [Aedes albopictus]|uniref:O-acyltransferase WSD1 C-terminal domain-containing protein n=1 Tax=Aedes albopictus TaxID=7160 RepID=A0ABM1YEG9_AEDAL